MDELKGCVACGVIYVMPTDTFCDRCRCAGHISRLKTEKEIITDLKKEHVKKYPIAIQRRKDLLREMNSWEISINLNDYD